jgi:outer membrane protein assembly factor BamB
MSSANYYITPHGDLYIIYGTQAPYGGTTVGSNLLAVNETNPYKPALAWAYHVTDAINTGLGDVPPVVDQRNGIALTDVLVNTGTSSAPVLNIRLIAVDTRNGNLLWTTFAGGVPSQDAGFVPVAFKGSVPMVHNGVLYVGDLLDQTYQAYNEFTGARLWQDELQGADPRDLPGTVHQPRAGSAYWHGKIIEAEGIHIWTFDAKTGKILNDYMDTGYFGVWGITSPVIVGNEMYLGSISGWAFAVPVQYVTTNPGPGPVRGVANLLSDGQIPTLAQLVPRPPSSFDPANLPNPAEAALFPTTWINYEGDPSHTDSYASALPGVSWSTSLPHSVPLSDEPRDLTLFGAATANTMTNLAFGATSGLAPANGIIYVGSHRGSVWALNAVTGQPIWSFDTLTSDASQPLVTPHAVVVSAGDPWFNFKQAQLFVASKPGLHVGANFSNLHGLNPVTGQEMWTFYTQGTDSMTPVYANGNLYWVDGKGNLWAINASTGKPVGAPFEDAAGNPTLNLGGINVLDSGVPVDVNGTELLVTGIGSPARLVAVNLATDQIAWTLSQLPSDYTPYGTGFAASTPAYDPATHTLVASILANATSPTANSGDVTSLAIGINALNGSVEWATPLGTGPLPYGYSAGTPVISNGTAFIADPVTGDEIGLSVQQGKVLDRTPLPGIDNAAGAAVGHLLIQPAGNELLAIDTSNGQIVGKYNVGGNFVDQSPTVVGQTIYLPNGFGWVLAIPVAQLGNSATGLARS